MTSAQADSLVELLTGAYPGTWPAITKSLYAERLEPVPFHIGTRAVNSLIETTGRRPSLADLLGKVRTLSPAEKAKPWPVVLPLTVAEWHELSELLGTAADESTRAGRKTAAALHALALFYAANADRVEAEEPPRWPPSGFGADGGVFAHVLAGLAQGKIPEDRRRLLRQQADRLTGRDDAETERWPA